MFFNVLIILTFAASKKNLQLGKFTYSSQHFAIISNTDIDKENFQQNKIHLGQKSS